MSRSRRILVVTVIAVAAGYYGFSRLAADSGPTGIAQHDAQLTAHLGASSVSPVASSVSPVASSAGPAAGGDASTAAGEAGSVAITTASAAASGSSEPAQAAAFVIAISKTHPPAPSDVIRIRKDDRVTLSITTDRPGHLEVHGYRKEVKIEPGTTAMLSFAAVRTGRFPLDLHASDGAHVEVTALEVLPR